MGPDADMSGYCRSFELYSDVLFLDMMKRKINFQEWLYVGPVDLNDNKKIEVGCGGDLSNRFP
jgi:hypothetical protein